jgi:hypothetical protein
MRLLKQADGAYALIEISRLELAKIQLCLLINDQPALRVAGPAS